MDKETWKKYLLTGITVITLVEAYFNYIALKNYSGIYQTGVFIPLLLQPILYRKFFMSEEKVSLKNWKLLAMATISIVLPFIIFFTLPDYTYAEGKEMIAATSTDTVNFIELKTQNRTIPSIGRNPGFLKSSRVYYYIADTGTEKNYFVVDPLTGEVQELDQDFYREY
jgi:hypothetical protein